MGSIGDPKTWVPYVNTRDCSEGFCSLYCPQWCYMMFSPPPPPMVFQEDNSGPTFSPLVIAIIGILASAFLLVSYYAIISKYCGRRTISLPRRETHHIPDEEIEENPDPSNHEPWHVSNNGLEETLIKSITVCKYKKGEGLIEFTDCSVCLGEFQEDDCLRLLPKCSHAFHVNCIDTWLKSHSNCPLCRANIGFVNSSPFRLLPPPPPPIFDDSDSDSSVVPPPPLPPHIYTDSDTDSSTLQEWQESPALNCPRDRTNSNVASSDTVPRGVSSDLQNPMIGDAVIEIREEQGEQQHIRRSVSMDYSCESHVSIADDVNEEEEVHEGMEERQFESEVGTSKGRRDVEGTRKDRNRNRVLHCVMSRPMAMKRSFSCGRLLFTRRGRWVNLGIPL